MAKPPQGRPGDIAARGKAIDKRTEERKADPERQKTWLRNRQAQANLRARVTGR